MIPAVALASTFSQRTKVAVLTGLLALSLMVGVTTAPRVAAEPVGWSGDSLSYECQALQTQAQQLLEEYKEIAYASNGQDPRLADLLQQIRNIGMTWQQIGCQAAYGGIVGATVPVFTSHPVGVPIGVGATQAKSR